MDVRPVAALYVMPDTVYRGLPGVDCWDKARDARLWPGGCAVVAHPPCRAWSRLRHFARPEPGEVELGPLAVGQVRQWGGVLEHPSGSKLWAACGLPAPGGVVRDEFGGWSLAVSQKWWGHRAEKRTWLYVVGVKPGELPAFPLVLGEAERTVGLFSGRDRRRCRGEISKRERIASPPEFARWLVELARRARV